MQLRVKRLCESAVMPFKAHPTDAGADLVAVSREFDGNGCVVYGTGLAFEIPEGHVGMLFPRSSNARKDLVLTNSVGIIDSGYRGEVMLKFKPSLRFDDVPDNAVYDVGDKVGQIVIIPYPEVEYVESDILSSSDRGSGGYGSSGR